MARKLVGDEYAEERSRERKGDIAAAMERAFAEQAAETEGFDAAIASKTARWLPDGMAFKGVDDLMETPTSPNTSDVDAAEDNGETASDAGDSAPDALPAFLSETAA
jgi:ParB family chromosome partitioning protein